MRNASKIVDFVVFTTKNAKIQHMMAGKAGTWKGGGRGARGGYIERHGAAVRAFRRI